MNIATVEARHTFVQAGGSYEASTPVSTNVDDDVLDGLCGARQVLWTRPIS